jgi:hypothetical protein
MNTRDPLNAPTRFTWSGHFPFRGEKGERNALEQGLGRTVRPSNPKE